MGEQGKEECHATEAPEVNPHTLDSGILSEALFLWDHCESDLSAQFQKENSHYSITSFSSSVACPWTLYTWACERDGE